MALTSPQREKTALKVVFQKVSFSEAKHQIQRFVGFFSSQTVLTLAETHCLYSVLLLLFYVITMQFSNAVQVVQDYTYYTVVLLLSQ